MAEQPKLSDEFRDFLMEAKAHSYGSESAQQVALASGATKITYQDGDWLYIDHYAGGDPFMGYEHISVRGTETEDTWLPVWGMHYQGEIKVPHLTGARLSELLGRVLTRPDPRIPIRGPFMHFFDNGWGRYELRPSGTLEKFTAFELIGRGVQRQIYKAEFMGGLINRKPDLESQRPKWLDQSTQ